MNPLKILGKQQIAGKEFTGIEGGFGEGKKSMLVKEIAEIHSQNFGELNRRINDNINRFIKNIDILDIKANGFEPLGQSLGFTKQTFNQSNNIYLLSERGYAKLLKILEDDTSWEIYDQLVDEYFNMREKLDTSQLSPELQMFNKLFNSLAKSELEQKRLGTEIARTNAKVDNISEIVSLNSDNWRELTSTLINKIAKSRGGYGEIKEIRSESYELLQERSKCNLSRRLDNKKSKAALAGATKTEISKINNLDVIGSDKRLLEIYLIVVKEMALKYKVGEIND